MDGRRLFNESFFHFVLGFAGMLAVSLALTFFISYYDTGSDTQMATVSDAAER